MLAIASPFDLNGSDFLKLYGLLAVAAIVGGAALRIYFSGRANPGRDDEDPTPYEVACLSGPAERAVHAAIAQLCQDGLISVDERSGDVSLVAPGEVAGRAPLEQSVLRTVAVQSPAKMAAVVAACAPELSDLQASLRAKGLLLDAKNARLGWLIPVIAFAAIQLLGLIRFFVGLSRDKPVGFLVGAWLAVGLIGSIFFGKKLYQSKRGSAVLAALRARYEGLKRQEAAAGATVASPGLASLALPLAIGIFGYSVLVGTPAESMYQRFRATGTGDGGGSTGDSGSSGDGGGDSGGGGGCGGCGGGGGD